VECIVAVSVIPIRCQPQRQKPHIALSCCHLHVVCVAHYIPHHVIKHVSYDNAHFFALQFLQVLQAERMRTHCLFQINNSKNNNNLKFLTTSPQPENSKLSYVMVCLMSITRSRMEKDTTLKILGLSWGSFALSAQFLLQPFKQCHASHLYQLIATVVQCVGCFLKCLGSNF